MVRNQTNVGEGPTKNVGKDEDRGILGVTGDVGLRVVEGGLLARGSAVPLEASFAVFAGHFGLLVFDFGYGDTEKLQLS